MEIDWEDPNSALKSLKRQHRLDVLKKVLAVILALVIEAAMFLLGWFGAPDGYRLFCVLFNVLFLPVMAGLVTLVQFIWF